LLHAIWNLFAKKAAAGMAFSALAGAATVVLWAPVGLTALLRELDQLSPRAWGFMALSALIHVVYFGTLMRGYELSDLSVVYPTARGSGPLITVVGSVLFLGESPGVLGWLGVLLIIIGMVTIATGGSLARFRSSKNVGLGLKFGAVTGVMIAAYSLLDGYAVKRIGISPITFDWTSNTIRLLVSVPLAWIVVRRGDTNLRTFISDNRTSALVVGAISPLSYVLVLQAAKMSDLSKVAPAREVSMLFAALFAGSLLHEDHAGARIVGASAIAGGVMLIALS
jgi:uncharacterized membrane protein